MRPRTQADRRRAELRAALLCLSLLLLAVAAPSAAAPPPAGPFSIEVRVEDHRGRALPEAGIEIRWLAAGQPSEPAVARSDAAGRARLAGLAAGSWQLTVRHERFMTFVAELAVSAGKPQIVAARQENVRGATAPLRVRVARGPVAAVAARDAVPPRPTPPAVRPAEPPIRPAEPPVRPTVPAPVAPAPLPASPAPAPPPVAPPPAPPPPIEPAPAVASPPAAPPLAAPVVPRPPEAAAPPPAAPPAAPSLPSPGTVTRVEPLAVAVRRHADRTCPECPPGEAARSVERGVAAAEGGSVPCPESAWRELAEAAPEAWGELAGALPAGCAALAVELPGGARYTGYRYESGTAGGWVDCPAGRDCPGLTAGWLGDPVVHRQGAKTWLVALFANRSEGPRRARFTAYYREPRP